LDVDQDRLPGPFADIFRAIENFDNDGCPLPLFSPERDFLTRATCSLFIATRGVSFTIKMLKQGKDASSLALGNNSQQINTPMAVSLASHLGIEPLVERLLSTDDSRRNQYATWKTNIFGCPPIYAATLGNQLDIVRLLLDHGADAYARSEARFEGMALCAFELAVRLGYFKIMEEILSRPILGRPKPFPIFSNCLYYASQHGHVEVVKALLSRKGLSINLKTYDNWKCIFLAGEKGHREIMKLLAAKRRHNPNEKRWFPAKPPLIEAAKRGWIDVVQALLKHPKIDPNLSYRGLVSPSYNAPYAEDTALTMAARAGFADVVVALLDHPKTDKSRKVRDADGNLVTAAEIAYTSGHFDAWNKLLTDRPASDSRKRRCRGWR
jgi:ankyrin repeat protein